MSINWLRNMYCFHNCRTYVHLHSWTVEQQTLVYMHKIDWSHNLEPFGEGRTANSILVCGKLILYVHHLSSAQVPPSTYTQLQTIKLSDIITRIFWLLIFSKWFNILRLRANGRHFPDDIFTCIFLNENVYISIRISLRFLPKGPHEYLDEIAFGNNQLPLCTINNQKMTS